MGGRKNSHYRIQADTRSAQDGLIVMGCLPDSAPFPLIDGWRKRVEYLPLDDYRIGKFKLEL